MKLFIIGFPKSGRTTVAKALCQDIILNYIDAFSWIRSTFRDQKPNEHPQQYEDEFHHWFTNRLKMDPLMCQRVINDSMHAYEDYEHRHFVIDGVNSPKDFADLFDYKNDFVVFLNRTDNDAEFKDYENIGVSVMRDYCFWLSSAGLLPKNKWFEYNFKMMGEDSDAVKALGSKNSVFIIKSIKKVISHLIETVNSFNLQGPQS